MNPAPRIFWYPLQKRYILFTPDILAHIYEYQQKWPWSREAGGELFTPDPEADGLVIVAASGPSRKDTRKRYYFNQACLRPRDRFWDIPVPKIDSAFDNLFVPQPSWSPSTTQQLRKLVAAPYLPPNDWTPRSEAYFVFPLAQGTPGKQCGLAATGVYQPSLRSPWLAAQDPQTATRERERQYKQGLHAVGLWHTHPQQNPTPSWQDKKTAKQYFDDFEGARNRYLLVVMGKNEPAPNMSVWSIETKGWVELIE
ncbi:Mov34/MPN/PAD-1 family protein [Thiolapillus sp.]|uniref:Mov34/MPN/PAD-1 family protein n=1 Tax=Thiolapillus sp. TaxID=2017437 RepID=UPI003AF55762